MDDTNQSDKNQKMVLKSIAKWLVIFALIAFVCYKNQDLMQEALEEIQITPVWKLVMCLLLGNLYFIAEGCIISEMTNTCDHRLSVWQGITCAYLCTFFRIATLGSGTGVAQLYYYNLNGIRKYAWYMFAGAVVISLICLFLFILTVSKKFSDLIMKLARKLVKQKSRLYPLLDKAQVSIDYLQEQGRIVWKDKRLFLTVVGLNFFKFACWYAIPGIFFAGSYSVTVATCLGLTAVCNMVGCVMLAPSGVGTLDFVFALFFACVIPDGDAVAAALVIYRLFTWIVPFVIGLVPALAVRKRDEK